MGAALFPEGYSSSHEIRYSNSGTNDCSTRLKTIDEQWHGGAHKLGQ